MLIHNYNYYGSVPFQGTADLSFLVGRKCIRSIYARFPLPGIIFAGISLPLDLVLKFTVPAAMINYFLHLELRPPLLLFLRLLLLLLR